MSDRPHLVIVDDDREIRTLLSQYLEKHDFRTTAVAEGKEMRRVMERSRVDLVVLDLMLPGEDGLAICRELRTRSQVPIIMLTARGEDTDRVVGLELGADDYVPKPFNPRELLARMRAVLRRTQRSETTVSADRLEVGDLQVDIPAHKATLGGAELQLTSFEFRVLVALARRAGETVTREELASVVLPKGGRYDPSVDRALDVHVSHLRQKLGDEAREPRRIRTVRWVGYVLVKPS